MEMPHPSWNESYASGQVPWDTGQPEPLLVEFVTARGIAPARTLEIGAGTGTNAIWLAQRGFDVLGIDVSPLAVEQARAKIEGTTCAAASLHRTLLQRLRLALRSSLSLTVVAFTSLMSQARDSGSRRKSLLH